MTIIKEREKRVAVRLMGLRGVCEDCLYWGLPDVEVAFVLDGTSYSPEGIPWDDCVFCTCEKGHSGPQNELDYHKIVEDNQTFYKHSCEEFFPSAWEESG